jgi:hypoxanthine phosphoribosyltransferase
MTAKYKSLFRVNEPIGKTQGRLLRRYSRYKHGSAPDAAWFASRLTAMVEKDLKVNPNAVFVNPPFSTIPPAIMPVCKIVAKRTGVPLVILKTSVGSLSSQNYATLRTFAERKRANSTMKLAVSRIARLRGKTVFLIEDAINTGATAERVKHLLLSDTEASHVQIYSLIRLIGANPALEEKVNKYILQDKLKKELVQILTARSNFVGRYLIRSLFLMPENEFMQLAEQLPARVISNLCKKAKLYFCDGSQASRIRILLNLRAFSGSAVRIT